MATSTRWGGFRPDPYNPNAVDGDNDGIVQEGTLFERPAGTRFINLDGSEIREMLSGDNLTVLNGVRLVDANGKPAQYRQSWRTGQLSIGQRIGTIDSRGRPTVGQIVGTVEPRRAPAKAAPKINANDIVVPERLGGSRGLSDLKDTYPELFDADGALKKPSRPFTYRHGLQDGASDLMEGVTSWAEARERLRGKTIIAYDYETTDFVDSGGRGVQIGAVKIVDGEIVDRTNIYINPGIPMEEWSGFSRENLRFSDGSLLTPERVATFPNSRDAHQQFMDWIGDEEEYYMMGHNALAFDDILLEREYDLADIDRPRPAGRIDTLSLAKDINSDGQLAKRNMLGVLAEALDIELGEKAHTADADSEATGQLLFKLLDYAEERDLPIDLILPRESRDREQARMDQLDADTERYREAMGIYNEIIDTTKAAQARRAEERRDRDAVPEQTAPETPETDSPEVDEGVQDVVTPDEINAASERVGIHIGNLIDDLYITFTDDESAEPGLVYDGDDRDDLDYEMILTADGKIPELDEGSAAALEDIKRVGRGLRLEAIRQFEADPETQRRRKAIDEINIGIIEKQAEIDEIDKPTKDYEDSIAQEMFGKPSNLLTDSERNEFVRRLGSDLEYDRLTAYNQRRDELESEFNSLAARRERLLLAQRRSQARYLRALLTGESADGEDRRYVERRDLGALAPSTKVTGGSPESRKKVQETLDTVESLLPPEMRSILQEAVDEYGLRIEIVPDSKTGGHPGSFSAWTNRDTVTGRFTKPSMVITISEEVMNADNPDGGLEGYTDQIILHEMLHAVQASSPEMFIAEQLFGRSRNVGIGRGDVEVHPDGIYFQDDFSSPYSGKIYRNSEGVGGFYETITNSVDKVLFPTAGDVDQPADDDQIDFALGVMLTTRKVDTPSRQTFDKASPNRALAQSTNAQNVETEQRLEGLTGLPGATTPADAINDAISGVDRTEMSIPGEILVADRPSPRDTPPALGSGPLSTVAESHIADIDGLQDRFYSDGTENPYAEIDTKFRDRLVLDPEERRKAQQYRRKNITEAGREKLDRIENTGAAYYGDYVEVMDSAITTSGINSEELTRLGQEFNSELDDFAKATVDYRKDAEAKVYDKLKTALQDLGISEKRIETILESVTDSSGSLGFRGLAHDRHWFRPIPNDPTPESLRADIDERSSLMVRSIIADLNEKLGKGRRNRPLSADEEYFIRAYANELAEATFKLDMGTFIFGDSPEAEGIKRLREGLVIDGTPLTSIKPMARLEAARSFFKSISPLFGTGKIDRTKINTEGLMGTMNADEVALLLSELEKSVPKYWIDWFNQRGYRLIVTDRGYHNNENAIIAISDRMAETPMPYGMLHRDPIRSYLSVLIHELAHGVSTDSARSDDTVLTPNRIKHNALTTDLLLSDLAELEQAISIGDGMEDEFSLAPATADYSYKYMLKTYWDTNSTSAPNEILTVLTEALLPVDSDKGWTRLVESNPDAANKMFGLFLTAIVE